MRRLSPLAALALAVLVLSAASAHAADPELPPQDEDQPTKPRVTKAKPRARAYGFLGGGPSYGEIFGIGSKSMTAEAGGAVDIAPYVGATFGLAGNFGKTEIARLSTNEVVLFGTLDVTLASRRLRMGMGPELSYFWMSRASSSHAGDLAAIGIGLRGRISIDILRFHDDDSSSSRAIFLAVSPDVEWLRGTDSFFHRFDRGPLAWRTNATAGIRF